MRVTGRGVLIPFFDKRIFSREGQEFWEIEDRGDILHIRRMIRNGDFIGK